MGVGCLGDSCFGWTVGSDVLKIVEEDVYLVPEKLVLFQVSKFHLRCRCWLRILLQDVWILFHISGSVEFSYDVILLGGKVHSSNSHCLEVFPFRIDGLPHVLPQQAASLWVLQRLAHPQTSCILRRAWSLGREYVPSVIMEGKMKGCPWRPTRGGGIDFWLNGLC